jgi:2-amino-4-hydroxy-6-hydroxymethyldihydropteridine diphosphokinase
MPCPLNSWPPLMPDASSTAAIAIGSNLPSNFGTPEQNLLAAIDRIRALGSVSAVSSFRVTDPVGFTSQPDFVNGALLLETSIPPLELMSALLAIEQAMGRDRASVPVKGPRIIDLDLILYDAVVLTTPQLTLPHPAMHLRAFVLTPLAEIAPDGPPPPPHRTPAELLNALSPAGPPRIH